MIHQLIVGVSMRTYYFQPTMWEPRGTPLADIGTADEKDVVTIRRVTLILQDPKG